MKRVFCLLVALIMAFPLNAFAESEKRSVLYYASWSCYGPGVVVADIDTRLVTHINFAFANLGEDGSILVGDSWADLEKSFIGSTGGHFGALRALKKKNPKLKTLISVGGWTWSRNFSDVAASAAKRKKFAVSAAEFIKKHGFDGVDIDWEYPVSGGDGIKHRPEDKTNYTLLLKETRAALNALEKKSGKEYLLSIAGGADSSFVKNIETKEITKYVDFINIMTYDYHGGWESKTGHNAPLFSDGASVASSVQSYLKAGAPAAKLNLGLALYGRGWTNVKSSKLGASGTVPTKSGFGKGTYSGGVFSYWDIAKNYVGKSGYVRTYDKSAKVPYLYNGKTFISYEDELSIRYKAEFARRAGLGGIMFWEFSQDKDKKLQKAAFKQLII